MTTRRLAALLLGLALAVLLVGACKKTSTPPLAEATCKSDDDCTISCAARGQCCQNPCCNAVLHKDVAADAIAFNRVHCKKEDLAQCPDVGACAPDSLDVTPRCRAGACTAEQKPATDAASPEASAPSGADARAPAISYDKSCAKDEDCVPATGCCPVPCSSLVVNRKELPKIAERNLATCPKNVQCFSAGGCRTHAYLCVRKTCALVFQDSPDYRARP